MDHIVLQLKDIRKPGKIETKDANVTNFSILSIKPKRRIGSKGKMSYQIIDKIKIVGLQNRSLNEKLNLAEITTHDSEIQSELSKYSNQHYKCHFIVNSPLITSVIQETNVIFLISNGINDARTSLINGKIYKSFGVVNVNEITNWTE